MECVAIMLPERLLIGCYAIESIITHEDADCHTIDSERAS